MSGALTHSRLRSHLIHLELQTFEQPGIMNMG